MGLQDLRERLAELRRQRAGAPKSLKSVVSRQTKTPRSMVFLPDKHLDLVSDADMNVFLEKDKTDELKYKPPWDCDKFSLRFHLMAKEYSILEKGVNWAVADVWTQKHALNLYVRAGDMKVVFLEPQSDMRVKIHSKIRFIKF